MIHFPKKYRTSFVATPVLVAMTALPQFASAQVTVTDFKGVISRLNELVNPLAAFIIGLAFVAFIWGVAKMIIFAEQEQKRAEGKQVMVWGIVGLFVIISLWGLVTLLVNTFFAGGIPLPWK